MTKPMLSRPKIDVLLSKSDIITEVLGWILLFLMWCYVLFVYSKLPEIIPTHFSFSGKADAYGSKSSIFTLPILGLVIFVLLTILNRFPHIFNYPVTITEDNALQQYKMGTRVLRYLKLIIAIIFLTIIYFTTK